MSPKQRLIRTLKSNRLKLEATTKRELFQATCLVHKVWRKQNWMERKVDLTHNVGLVVHLDLLLVDLEDLNQKSNRIAKRVIVP